MFISQCKKVQNHHDSPENTFRQHENILRQYIQCTSGVSTRVCKNYGRCTCIKVNLAVHYFFLHSLKMIAVTIGIWIHYIEKAGVYGHSTVHRWLLLLQEGVCKSRLRIKQTKWNSEKMLTYRKKKRKKNIKLIWTKAHETMMSSL